MNTTDLFSTPIGKAKVRNNIYAYRYPNGIINIAGQRYIGYSMTAAIRLWRKGNKINNH